MKKTFIEDSHTFRMLTQDLSLFLQQFARIITFLLASLFYILCAKDLWGIEVIYHFSIQDEKEIFYLLSNTVKTRKRETLRLSAEEIKREFYLWESQKSFVDIFFLVYFFNISGQETVAPFLSEGRKSFRCNVLILGAD